MVGRITEKHLGEAEKTFPGIGRMYRSMTKKPTTFLQLVWRYEAIAAAGRSRAPTSDGVLAARL